MRRVTRDTIAGIFAVLVLLLALGALPGLLKSGDPYYVTATPVSDGSERSSPSNASREAVDVSNLSARSYPYTTAALADASANAPGQAPEAGQAGRSGPYWKGPVGFKETFTHSPFDEVRALRQQYPDAATGDGVVVSQNGTLYRVAVAQ